MDLSKYVISSMNMDGSERNEFCFERGTEHEFQKCNTHLPETRVQRNVE